MSKVNDNNGLVLQGMLGEIALKYGTTDVLTGFNLMSENRAVLKPDGHVESWYQADASDFLYDTEARVSRKAPKKLDHFLKAAEAVRKQFGLPSREQQLIPASTGFN